VINHPRNESLKKIIIIITTLKGKREKGILQLLNSVPLNSTVVLIPIMVRNFV